MIASCARKNGYKADQLGYDRQLHPKKKGGAVRCLFFL
jgi:hypothetical protein